MSEAVNRLRSQVALASGREHLRLLVDLAFALREVDAREGLNVTRTAIDLAQADKDWTALASLLIAEALNLDRLGDYHAALVQLDKAQKINQKLGDIGILSRIWNARGVIFSNQGQLPEALHHYLLSEGICEESRNYWMLSAVLNNIGIVYDRLGRHDEAFASYGRALKLAHSIGREDIELHAVSNLGFNRMFLQLWDEALKYHKEALSYAQKQENEYGIIICTANIAESYGALGEVERAHKLFADAIGRSRALGDLEHLVDLLYEQAKLYLKSNEWRPALALLQETLELVRQMG
ncbi:tetratricopeptide repeat protein, partial [Deinococcus sp. HMF7620]